MMKHRCSCKAFTIIESLVMLAALAVLTWVVFSLWRSQKQAGMEENLPSQVAPALLTPVEASKA